MTVYVFRVHLQERLQVLIERVYVADDEVLRGLVVHGRCPVGRDDFDHDLVEKEVWEAAIRDSRCFFDHWEWSDQKAVWWEVLIEEVTFKESDHQREFKEE